VGRSAAEDRRLNTLCPPKLGGGITPAEWLRQLAQIERRRDARMRAREAEAIAIYLTALENTRK
jgi:hypothetical protein